MDCCNCSLAAGWVSSLSVKTGWTGETGRGKREARVFNSRPVVIPRETKTKRTCGRWLRPGHVTACGLTQPGPHAASVWSRTIMKKQPSVGAAAEADLSNVNRAFLPRLTESTADRWIKATPQLFLSFNREENGTWAVDRRLPGFYSVVKLALTTFPTDRWFLSGRSLFSPRPPRAPLFFFFRLLLHTCCLPPVSHPAEDPVAIAVFSECPTVRLKSLTDKRRAKRTTLGKRNPPPP